MKRIPNLEEEFAIHLLAGLIYGEARGEPVKGQLAVAWTVRNRVQRPSWWGKSWVEVILKPYQYSCWGFNERGEPNWFRVFAHIKEASPMQFCIGVLVYQGHLIDPTQGATHYHTVTIRPAWADKLRKTVTIGNHQFYVEE